MKTYVVKMATTIIKEYEVEIPYHSADNFEDAEDIARAVMDVCFMDKQAITVRETKWEPVSVRVLNENHE